MKKPFCWMRRMLCAGVLMAAAGSAAAQSAAGYPAKPVRLVVPFLAGSGTDAIARMFGDRFGKDLGQAFVIDNRGGANGVIGTTLAARAAPDGYTLMVNTGMYLVNHWLQPDLPFDSIRDLAPISMLARSDWALAVHPAFPADNLKEFVAYAKANPGKVNMSTTGSIGVIVYQLFMNTTGTKVTLVNYKGGPQPMADLVAGRINGAIAGAQNLGPQIRAGKVKGLAIAGDKRNPSLPNVPTFAETGLKDFDPHSWFALIAPSKAPRDIVEKMNVQVKKAQASPEVMAALAKQVNDVYPTSVAQAERFVRVEAERLGKLIKEAGIKAEED